MKLVASKMTITGRIKIVFVSLTSVVLLLITHSSYNYQGATIRNEGDTQFDGTSHYTTLLSVSLTEKAEKHTQHKIGNISTHSSIIIHNISSSYEETSVNNSTQPNNSSSQSTLNTASTETNGYIVALKIYEQQTMASGNLLQLQCWASYLNMVVVKPFMKDSNMLTPMTATKQQDMLRMEDTFDMHDWEAYSKYMGYAPLVEWAEFISSAPKKLIIVQVKYVNLDYVRSVIEGGNPFPHPPSEEKPYAQNCKFKLGLSHLQENGFEIVRKVCLNFRIGDEITMKEMKEHILGEYGKQNEKVSVIIDMWRGVGKSQRFIIKDKICENEKNYREHTKPSKRLLNDAQIYTDKYLGGKNGDTPYVALIGRFEMTGLTRHGSSSEDKYAIIPECLKITNQHLQAMKSVKHIQKVFLSMDIGKYGSSSFKKKHYFGHLSEMEGFVEKTQNMSTNNWEKTFESVTNTQDSGYIGMLQLVLAAKADCILFVGGGTFQRHALHLYQELHTNQTHECVRIVEKCTSPNRPVVK